MCVRVQLFGGPRQGEDGGVRFRVLRTISGLYTDLDVAAEHRDQGQPGQYRVDQDT